MKTNTLNIFFCFIFGLLSSKNEANAQRIHGVRDSTIYIINSTDTIVAGEYSLYKKQGFSFNLIKEFNEIIGDSSYSSRAWIRDFDFWDSQNWYVLLGWSFPTGNSILYKTNDAGISWTYDTSYYNQSQYHSLNQMQIVDNQRAFLFDGYYLSDVLKTNDGGSTWDRWIESGLAHHYGIFICNDTTYYLWGLSGDPFNPYMFPIPTSAFNNLNNGLSCNQNPDCINAIGLLSTADIEQHFSPIFDSICSQVLSVNELNLQYNILVYPNPTNGKATLMFSDNIKNGIIEIYNSQGQKVKQSSVEGALTTVDITNLTSGVYHYQLQYDIGVLKSGKIIIE